MNMELADEINVKVDSKGRICIPADFREEIGATVAIKRVPAGFLLVPGKKEDADEKLRRIINSKHKRTGKPENWSPEKMKSIWGKTQ
jgi:DNA-binding transcriptional regulator/RsmH inhibitor MraZ